MIESFKLPTITPETLTGSIVSFNDEYGNLPLKSCTSLITGYQEGSGTPSPNNVRPLHAFSSATLTACGVNLAEEVFEDGYISSAGALLPYDKAIRSANFNPCKPNTTYSCIVPAGMSGYAVCWYDENKSYISRTINVLNVTAPINAFYFKLSLYNYKDSFPIYSNNVSLNYPSTDTGYHAYNGNTYTFTFGQSIYQGSIDWKRGVVVGNMLLYDIGSQNWYKSSSGANPFFYRSFTSSPDNNIVSEIYQFYGVISSTEFGNNAPNYNFGVNSTGSQLYIRDDTYTDPADFKTAMDGVMLAYELATPIEIPLGGINLLTQEGQNNIYADCGDTEVKYIKVN